jgi:glyoxylate/hydroxypyruvate/2-ketogluconate reductase
MKKPKVYITDHIPSEVEEYIGKFCDYEIWPQEGKIPKQELIEKLKDIDGLIVDMINIDKEIIENAPQLKVVCNMSVGYNNLDLETMKKRKIMGTNTPDILNDSVADLVMGLILSTARRIPEMDSYVKRGNWQLKDYKSTFGVDVHHSTIGIIGMGRIGEVVAKRAKYGFDANVLYYNRNRKLDVEASLGITYTDMRSLLKNSDFVVLMTPLTSETLHLIDFEEFSLMKPSAIFINASRGQTVNEKALIDALKTRKILAAGLDVFEKEPVETDNELLTMSNAVTLPHLGTATEKTTFDMAMLAGQNLVKALFDGNPPNLVPELKNIDSL